MYLQWRMMMTTLWIARLSMTRVKKRLDVSCQWRRVKNVDRHVASPWRRWGWHPLYTTALICLSFPRGAATRGNKGRGTEARNKKQSVRQPFVCRWAVRRVVAAGTHPMVRGCPVVVARSHEGEKKKDRMRKGADEERGRGRAKCRELPVRKRAFRRHFYSFPRKTPLTRARPDLRFGTLRTAEVSILERDRRPRPVSPRERNRDEIVTAFEQVRPPKSELETPFAL